MRAWLLDWRPRPAVPRCCGCFALPDPPARAVTAVGVDDFALRRGEAYGTLVIDLDTHQPVDLLPDRESGTVAAWLKEHPEIGVVTRDRSLAYADAANTGAPQATQVADRWHLWKNLGEAVEKTVIAHRACLRAPEPDPCASSNSTVDTPDAGLPVGPAETRLVVRTRERHAAVRELMDQGLSLSAITRELGLDRHTVRRFARATSVDDLLDKTTSKSTVLDRFKPYRHQRWNEGCTEAAALFDEIKKLGYRGSPQTVRRYLHPFRATLTASELSTPSSKVRHVTGWIMRDPASLKESESLRLKQILARCPELDAARAHVGTFANVIQRLASNRLPEWIDRVQADDLPALHAYIASLRRDWNAVVAGLTLPLEQRTHRGSRQPHHSVESDSSSSSLFALFHRHDRQQVRGGQDADLAWRGPSRCRDIDESLQELVEGCLAVIDRGLLLIGERDVGQHRLQIVPGLQQLSLGGCFRGVEVAAGASHPMWTL